MMKTWQSLWHYLGDSSRRSSKDLTEGPDQMGKTSNPTLIVNQVKRR
jgi:hypothetical protein